MKKPSTPNIGIAEISIARTFQQYAEFGATLTSEEKSYRKVAADMVVLQQVLVRAVIVHMKKSKKFKAKVEKKTKGIAKDSAGKYYAIILLILFPHLVEKKKTSAVLKKLNRYNKIQEAAEEYDWDLNQVNEQCRARGGIRGVADDYIEHLKKTSTDDHEDDVTTTNDRDEEDEVVDENEWDEQDDEFAGNEESGKIQHKKLPANIQFVEKVKGNFIIVYIEPSADGLHARKIQTIVDPQVKKFGQKIFEQIRSE